MARGHSPRLHQTLFVRGYCSGTSFRMSGTRPTILIYSFWGLTGISRIYCRYDSFTFRADGPARFGASAL